MFDLDTRVDLDEVVTLRVDQELARSGVAVPDSLGDLAGVGEEALAHLLTEVGSRTLLDDLLMTTLNGAVALEKVDDVTGGVTEKLSLCKGSLVSSERRKEKEEERTNRCA